MRHRQSTAVSFVVVVLLLTALPAVLHSYAGVAVRIVRSGSMAPTMSPGDAAVVIATPVSELRTGDIALLFHPVDGEVAAHRIVSIATATHGITLRTKGDANPMADAPVQVPRSAAIERVAMVVPAAGYVLAVLGSPVVVLSWFALGLLTLIAFGLHNRRLPADSETNQ